MVPYKETAFFTFHNVSIKSKLLQSFSMLLTALHSTMYLLNPEHTREDYTLFCIFTFHNVSIKSCSLRHCFDRPCAFTFHNVSIKSSEDKSPVDRVLALHSTMYLLNPEVHLAPFFLDITLHSTMYLLNLIHRPVLTVIVLPLHSTMYLLNQWGSLDWFRNKFNFTFHNVSIKSLLCARYKHTYQHFTFHNVSIKSRAVKICILFYKLYIPQCIY